MRHKYFFPQDLMSDMIRHYYGQAIKQAYVIIFGLDVIGNPFGLVVGVSRSVEDLFYEPFQVRSTFQYFNKWNSEYLAYETCQLQRALPLH